MKTILITGATDGIGLATAKSLAALGNNLLIHGRSSDKLNAVSKLLSDINPNINISTYTADLSNHSDVISLVNDIKADYQQLDVIINNAGVFKTAEPLTSEGMDVRFVVNTLAPYKITTRLLSLLADNGRVINLSSAAQAPVNLKALSGEVHITDDFQAYAQSKLAITIWSQALAKSLKPQQIIVAVNPGSLLASKMVKEGFGMAGNDISIGSDILVRAALSEEFIGMSGKYYDNDSKQFALPHGDAQQSIKCDALMAALINHKFMAD